MAQAKAGDTVKVHYKGILDDGTIFDSSFEGEPLEFTIGEGEVIQGFEEAIEGMNEGESKTVTIPSEEAYGEYIPDLVVTIDKDNLPEEIQPEPGMMLRIRAEDGTTSPVTITDVSDQTVTLNGNHPLAGKDLTFEIKLVEVEQGLAH